MASLFEPLLRLFGSSEVEEDERRAAARERRRTLLLSRDRRMRAKAEEIAERRRALGIEDEEG